MNGYYEPNNRLFGPVPAATTTNSSTSAGYMYGSSSQQQQQPNINSIIFNTSPYMMSSGIHQTQPPPPTSTDLLNSSFGEKNWLTAAAASVASATNLSESGSSSSGGTSNNNKYNGNNLSAASSSSFLNNSFNLNNSMNLPPELRYKALSDMVGKITDEEFLAASGGAATTTTNPLNFNTYKNMYQQQHQSTGSIQQQPVHYFRQNDSNVNFSYEPIYTQLFRESETTTDSKQQQQQKVSQLPQIKEDQPSANNMIATESSTKTVPPLAFPPTYSHHLAKLNAEQQAYMMTQQQALVATMEQMSKQQLSPNQPPPHQLQHMISSSSSSSQSSTTSPLNNNFMLKLHNQQTSVVGSPTTTTIPEHQLRLQQQSMSKTAIKTPVNISSYPPPVMVQQHPPPFHHLSMYSPFPLSPHGGFHNHHQLVLGDHNLIPPPSNFMAYPHPPTGYFLPNGALIDPTSFMMMNEKFKQMMKSDPNHQSASQQHQQQQQQQAYRQHRRTGPANELHIRLEECMSQFKWMESERKKFEADLSHHHTRKSSSSTTNRVTSTLTIPANTAQVRLPANPSRVDRLVYDSMREYARLVTLVLKIDNLRNTIFFESIQDTLKKWLDAINNVQQKRKDELVNNSNKQRLQQHQHQQQQNRQSDERDVIVLANSIHELSSWTKRARRTLWSAIQISNVNYKQEDDDGGIIVVTDRGTTNNSESLFDSLDKTHQFIRKTFEIKTDLI